ncbi:unnamed protein product [Spirodela intermedia]|uniref:Uncharacterized protein n=1 Tax=Spirodela intermedia TaxID=51605 RepID=A0A7I8IVP4_SPIIN|nr:unnamed protein product [Spirodela intermedia]CAA6661219.1 unnamed protein product [Spirodela intermedia]
MTKEMWDTLNEAFGIKGSIAFIMDVFENIMKMCDTVSHFHVTFLAMKKFRNLFDQYYLDYSSYYSKVR